MAGRGKGKKTDIGWKYFADINSAEKIVQCSYCHKFIYGGITRGKEHLAGISGNTAACLKVPSEVSQQQMNSPFDTMAVDFFGSTDLRHMYHSHYYLNDDDTTEPARHSFWH